LLCWLHLLFVVLLLLLFVVVVFRFVSICLSIHLVLAGGGRGGVNRVSAGCLGFVVHWGAGGGLRREKERERRG